MTRVPADDLSTSRRREIKAWWTGTVDFLIEEWHLAAAAIASAGIVIASLAGLDDPKALSEATLGLLAALTLTRVSGFSGG